MSEATFTIGGKQYTISCADGEEAHVMRLGASVDAKLVELGENRAPQEAQNLLFAALLIAEDLHQLRNSITAERDEAEKLREELAAVVREHSTAAELEGELRATIAEHEAELNALNESLKSAAGEADKIRSDLNKLRDDLKSAEQVESELRGGLAGLVEERDAIQEEAEELRAALAAAAETGRASDGQTIDPDLAPALERFADLLENCADKLEGNASAS